MRVAADTLSEMTDIDEMPSGEPAGEPSTSERFLVSPLGILAALTISAAGTVLLGWLF
jgi:hypothetical protein